MKQLNRTIRNGIAIAILLLSVVPQTMDAKMQWDGTQNTSESSELPPNTVNLNESNTTDRPPFGDVKPPLQAPPPEGGDGQKLPVNGGVWILAGLALGYSLTCEIRRRRTASNC